MRARRWMVVVACLAVLGPAVGCGVALGSQGAAERAANELAPKEELVDADNPLAAPGVAKRDPGTTTTTIPPFPLRLDGEPVAPGVTVPTSETPGDVTTTTAETAYRKGETEKQHVERMLELQERQADERRETLNTIPDVPAELPLYKDTTECQSLKKLVESAQFMWASAPTAERSVLLAQVEIVLDNMTEFANLTDEPGRGQLRFVAAGARVAVDLAKFGGDLPGVIGTFAPQANAVIFTKVGECYSALPGGPLPPSGLYTPTADDFRAVFGNR